MKNKARDGRLFNSLEQAGYNNGYYIGKSRKDAGEFMGSATGGGFRGRNRLIFNEGLEDGYSGVVRNDVGECIQIGEWKTDDLANWKGVGVRIGFLFPPGTYQFGGNTVNLVSISNMNEPFNGNICEVVNLSELTEYIEKSK